MGEKKKSNIDIPVAGVNSGKTFSGEINIAHGLGSCEGVRLEVEEKHTDMAATLYLTREESMDLVRAILIVLREKGERT